MDNICKDVVLITGASSGIGKAAADLLKNLGYRVYGTSRRSNIDLEENDCATQKSKGFLKMLRLDVCSEKSVKEVIKYVMEREGRIDILINNAGFGIAGSVEDTSEEEAYRQFNTNFFGVHRMCKHILPIMREQRRGIIINISSVAGVISIPFQSMYSASKHALEALSEALRIEVKPWGIKVIIIEPGDTRTSFTSNREYVNAYSNSVYKERFIKSIKAMEKDEVNGPDPQTVAKVIADVIKAQNPPVRKVVGFFYKTVVFLKRFMPARFVQYVLSKMY